MEIGLRTVVSCQPSELPPYSMGQLQHPAAHGEPLFSPAMYPAQGTYGAQFAPPWGGMGYNVQQGMHMHGFNRPSFSHMDYGMPPMPQMYAGNNNNMQANMASMSPRSHFDANLRSVGPQYNMQAINTQQLNTAETSANSVSGKAEFFEHGAQGTHVNGYPQHHFVPQNFVHRGNMQAYAQHAHMQYYERNPMHGAPQYQEMLREPAAQHEHNKCGTGPAPTNEVDIANLQGDMPGQLPVQTVELQYIEEVAKRAGLGASVFQRALALFGVIPTVDLHRTGESEGAAYHNQSPEGNRYHQTTTQSQSGGGVPAVTTANTPEVSKSNVASDRRDASERPLAVEQATKSNGEEINNNQPPEGNRYHQTR